MAAWHVIKWTKHLSISIIINISAINGAQTMVAL
jgi:hypothetical protein